MDDIFVAAQLGQAHGAAGMQFLGADAHFAPQAKLSAIGKAGGGVDIHGGAVHTGGKAVCGSIVRRDDGLTVVGGMAGNVGNGSVYIIHHGNGQDVVQKFSVKILLAGGCSGNDGGSALIQPQIHRNQPGSRAGIHQTGFQQRQKPCGNILVYQAHFLGIAYAGAAGFGVLNDIHRHVQVSGFVHIHMADAGSGLDAGHRGFFHTGADQPGTAAGNQQVHQPVCRHQLVGGSMGGVLNQADGAFRQAGAGQAAAQSANNGMAAGPGIAPAAQHTGAARFQGQRGGIGGHVGAAFINNGDHAHGHRGFFNQQPVRPHNFAQHGTHRVRQGGNFTHALGHGGQPGRSQGKAIQHYIADVPARGSKILLVGGQDCIAVFHQGNCHGFQRSVFGIGIRQRQRQLCRLRR